MSETLTQFQTTSQDILHLAAASLCAAPGLTEAERTARSRTVIHGAMEFQPADSGRTILASLILGHYLAIMDGFRDTACLTLTPAEAARARMVTVAQTKLVLQMLREMRIARAEALARAAEEAGEVDTRSGFEAHIAKFMSARSEGLATPENADTPTRDAAAKAWDVLSQAIPPALFPPSLFPASGETNAVSEPIAGSRAQRRAMMKRNGAFRRPA